MIRRDFIKAATAASLLGGFSTAKAIDPKKETPFLDCYKVVKINEYSYGVSYFKDKIYKDGIYYCMDHRITRVLEHDFIWIPTYDNSKVHKDNEKTAMKVIIAAAMDKNVVVYGKQNIIDYMYNFNRPFTDLTLTKVLASNSFKSEDSRVVRVNQNQMDYAKDFLLNELGGSMVEGTNNLVIGIYESNKKDCLVHINHIGNKVGFACLDNRAVLLGMY
jgi:hypothetical protein